FSHYRKKVDNNLKGIFILEFDDKHNKTNIVEILSSLFETDELLNKGNYVKITRLKPLTNDALLKFRKKISSVKIYNSVPDVHYSNQMNIENVTSSDSSKKINKKDKSQTLIEQKTNLQQEKEITWDKGKYIFSSKDNCTIFPFRSQNNKKI